MPKGLTPLGDLLRDGRVAVGINQEEAAHRIGVSVKTYGDWERGKHTPGGRRLHALAETLKLDFDVLARAASGNTPPVDVQARAAEARAESAEADVAALRTEVEELRDQLRDLVAGTDDRAPWIDIGSAVDEAVAARLDEALRLALSSAGGHGGRVDTSALEPEVAAVAAATDHAPALPMRPAQGPSASTDSPKS